MAEVKEKITDETEVSTTELAAVLGVTARRVQQLAFAQISARSSPVS